MNLSRLRVYMQPKRVRCEAGVSISLMKSRQGYVPLGGPLVLREALRLPLSDNAAPSARTDNETERLGSLVGSQPVVVEGCFGWFHCSSRHDPASEVGSDVAVLLCPALGWDGLHSYHGFRLLADRFAVAGYPVLRFQYPGTGNSCDLDSGTDGAGEHWTAWQRSVQDAADWLRVTTGASRLLLVGLRFGATLAAAVAEQRADVEGLALLAPVLRGKSYMRQLDMEARLESGAPAVQGGGLEFHELSLGATTVEAISAVDLRRAKLRAGLKVAVFPQAPSNLVDGCVQAWVTRGAQVQCDVFDGLEPLLQEAIHCDPPAPDFTRLLAWTDLNIPPVASAKPDHGWPLPEAVNLVLADCTETPVRFGDHGRLFGVLCQPANAASERVVIIGNTGRDPHYGIARFGVQLARRLAAEGIASFRLDFSGLGDSPSAPGEGQALSSLFEADRAGDVSAAIDTLERAGYRSFAIQGVCSGAYHAYRAVQADQRLDTVLLVNLPVFEWQGGDSVKEAIWKSAPPSRLVARLADLDVWKRALHGDIQLRPALQAQGGRLLAAMRKLLRLGLAGAREGGADPSGRVMADLARRNVKSLFLYSPTDPGIDALRVAFGPEGERLRVFAGTDLRIVPGIDHVLSGHDMREKAVDNLVSFLAANPATSAIIGPR